MATTLEFLKKNVPWMPTSKLLEYVCEYLDLSEGTQRDFAEYTEDALNNGLIDGAEEKFVGGRLCGECGFKFTVDAPFVNTTCPACGSAHILNGYGG